MRQCRQEISVLHPLNSSQHWDNKGTIPYGLVMTALFLFGLDAMGEKEPFTECKSDINSNAGPNGMHFVSN